MKRSELLRNLWMGLATIATMVVVFFVVRPPEGHPTPGPRDLSAASEVARLVGPRLVAIAPGSALERKLDLRSVKLERVSSPLLTVTGSIAARLATGTASPEDRWQFASADVSATYADWRRAQNDVEYAQKQLAKTRDLAAAQIARFQGIQDRLRRLVDAGTDAPKDLAAAEADLLQAQLQGQKDVFDAESAANLALRNRAAAERLLFQAGVDPALLAGEDGAVIVVAEVPEAKASAVRQDEACEALFYGLPEAAPFRGRVARVAPTLSVERRTLRVLFVLADPDPRLRPGMFADIGLGTEPREALLVPLDAVLHVGRHDYVFSRRGAGPWRVAAVEIGEPAGGLVEVRGELAPGDEIIGRGAILLKPFLLQALES
jgi:hypothetical protein